jgi:hypothetical protein
MNNPPQGGAGIAICVLKGRSAMATIQPKGERLRQAVKWISSERQEDEKKTIQKLIQQAARRFNLSPAEEGYLITFYREQEGQES